MENGLLKIFLSVCGSSTPASNCQDERRQQIDELLLLRFVKERWSPSCGFPNLQVGLDSKFTRDTPSMLLSTLLSYLFWVSPGLID